MKLRNLLLAEDDDAEVDRVNTHVEKINNDKTNPFGFRLCHAKTEEDAVEVLRNQHIDCAVIDLKLPASQGKRAIASTGKRLLHKSLKENAIPHVIHTGYDGGLAEEIEDSYVVKIIDKSGGELTEVFDWFFEKAPLISAMASIRNDLMRETAELFQLAILPQWKETIEFRDEKEILKKILLRQIVSHLTERLSLPLSGAPKHHLNEFYFCPPLRKDRLHTGDLFRTRDGVFVVVTAQCNMAHKYPEQILVAHCNEKVSEFDDVEKLLEGNRRKRKEAGKLLANFANQQVGISRHFLPQCGGDGPWMVDFKATRCFSKRKVPELMKARFASITPQFIPNLIQRFAAYMGRHGQPDLDVEELEKRFSE